VHQTNVNNLKTAKFTLPGIKAALLSILLLFASPSTFSQATQDTAPEKIVYIFSGLGADSIPFANLKLPGYRKVYISWVTPLPGESLSDYAGRVKDQITAKDPYIIGLSFGGILAVEVSKQINVHKMVLISSAKTSDELNPVQFFFMRMGLYRIIPGFLLKRTNFLTYGYFGAHSDGDKKALMKLLQSTDISLFRWGLKSIALWDNKIPPERTIQIHGTSDKVIASRRVKPDYSIHGGGHLMILNKADTISKIILHYFNSNF
jgi:hypothetical protein